MLPRTAALLSVMLSLCACTTVHTTPPSRSATEERLVSTAIDRAADRLAQQMPANLKIFLDTSSLEGPDARYAAAAVADRFLRKGMRLMPDKAEADTVVVVRSGVLSSDARTTLIGMPQFAIPFFPVGNLLTIPELDFYRKMHSKGVAEFAATGFNPKTGEMVVSTDPQFGFSQKTDWVVLLLFGWNTNDLVHDAGSKTDGGM